MIRLKLAPVFILALSLTCLWPQPALAWHTSQTAKSVCENEKVSIDWTFINKESKRAIKLMVKEEQTGKLAQTRTVSASQAASGTFQTGKTVLQSGRVSFLVKWADGEKGNDIREVNYKKISCEPSPIEETTGTTKPNKPETERPLPNTGPLNTFGPFAAFVAASATSWLITRKELVDAAKQN